jgi:magnesium transporter
MPELHSRYGYYTVWVIMIVVAVAMLYFFKRKGWIGRKDLDEKES